MPCVIGKFIIVYRTLTNLLCAGGADHPDNYQLLTGHLNLQLKDKHYEVSCGIAGFQKTLKAVKVGLLQTFAIG